MSNYKKYSDLPTAEKKVQSSQAQANNSSPQNNLIFIESAEHKKKLISTSNGLVIDIYGDFCGPCKIIAPKFQKMANEFTQFGIVFAKEDVDKKLSPYVKGVPMFEYYLRGNKIGDTVGADETEIRNNVEKLKQMIVSQPPQQQQQQPHMQNQHFPQPYNNVNPKHAQVDQSNPMNDNIMMRRM